MAKIREKWNLRFADRRDGAIHDAFCSSPEECLRQLDNELTQTIPRIDGRSRRYKYEFIEMIFEEYGVIVYSTTDIYEARGFLEMAIRSRKPEELEAGISSSDHKKLSDIVAWGTF